MEIYVVRHTKVTVGRETCYGQTDVAVAESFLEEAAAIKKLLPNNFDAVYCSPLTRCKLLATELAHESVIFDARLKEMHFGDWENKKWNDIDQQNLNEWMQDYVTINAPGGENLGELYKRIEQFLERLISLQHEKILIVCHAGVIRCMWTYILKMPLKNMFKIPIGFGEIFVFNLDADEDFNVITRKC